MAEHPMETTLRTAVWQQCGAAIDMLENALLACPETLWQGRLWGDPSDPLCHQDSQHSGISPITPSSGSTYISQAHLKDSPLLRPSPSRSLTRQVFFPNGPIPGMNSTPIWCICARSARQPSPSCQTSKRINRSISPGAESRAISNCSCTLCATCRNTQPN